DLTVTGVQTCALPIFAIPWKYDGAFGRQAVEVGYVAAGLERNRSLHRRRSCVHGRSHREPNRVTGVAGLVHDEHATPTDVARREIGRASCRERMEVAA